MTQYLLSVHGTDESPYANDEEMQAAFKAVDAFNEDLKSSGSWVFAGGLQPSDTATTVRIVDGGAVTTDGPYAETKEQIGGFWIIEVPNLDDALALAEAGARACGNPVEVRPFQAEPQD